MWYNMGGNKGCYDISKGGQALEITMATRQTSPRHTTEGRTTVWGLLGCFVICVILWDTGKIRGEGGVGGRNLWTWTFVWSHMKLMLSDSSNRGEENGYLYVSVWCFHNYLEKNITTKNKQKRFNLTVGTQCTGPFHRENYFLKRKQSFRC